LYPDEYNESPAAASFGFHSATLHRRIEEVSALPPAPMSCAQRRISTTVVRKDIARAQFHVQSLFRQLVIRFIENRMTLLRISGNVGLSVLDRIVHWNPDKQTALGQLIVPS
jgi:hypothetical protein